MKDLVIVKKGVADVTDIGLDFHGKTINKNTLLAYCTFFGRLSKASDWSVADAINAYRNEEGKSISDLLKEKRRKEVHQLYTEISERIGLSIERVKKLRGIGRRVPKQDRFPELLMEHYDVLLSRIENPERKRWASKAVKNHWTAAEMWQAYHDAALDELAKMPTGKVDENIGNTKPTKEEKELEDLDNIPSGISYEDIKEALEGDQISVFDIVWDSTRHAIEDASSFIKGKSSRKIQMLIGRLRKAQKYSKWNQ